MSTTMTLKRIAELIGCSVSTAGIYLCRSEFAHIKIKRLHQVRVYRGVFPRDIEHLKKLVNSRTHKSEKVI